jgi:hypothetical protein
MKAKAEFTVESPIRHGRYGHAILECLPAVHFNCLECSEASITPAPYCYPLRIDVLLRSPDLRSGNLVVCLIVANITSSDAA